MAKNVYLKKCGSTNDEILNFLPPDNNELFSVHTFNQTKGKGQYGNSWELSENLNLAFSIAIPSRTIKIRNILFNFHTALLLADFLANMTKEVVEIKWPNDLIIGKKKIGGMLIEEKIVNHISYYIVGIGINVLQSDFTNLPKAGSLRTQTGKDFDLTVVASTLHHYLSRHLMETMSEAEILKKLNEQLFGKNKIFVFQIKELRQNGIIKEVDKEGFLWIELEHDGLKKFFHKEVEMLY